MDKKKSKPSAASRPRVKLITRPSRCLTCYGFGLWYNSDQPMGPIDASDGCPTKACPACHSNHNPQI